MKAKSNIMIGLERDELGETNIMLTFLISVEDETSLKAIVLFLFNDFNNFEFVRKSKISLRYNFLILRKKIS